MTAERRLCCIVARQLPQVQRNADAWGRVIETCARRGIGQVCLDCRLDRQLTGIGPWQGHPEQTAPRLAAALGAAGLRRLAMAGASGTGLAALILAARLDAEGVLLMPAVTHFPDPATEPHPRAARAAAHELRHLPPGLYDARPFLQGKAIPVWAHVPGGSDFDRRQIAHLADYPHLHSVVHDFAGHGVMPWLVEQGRLAEEVEGFLRNIGWLEG